MKNIYSEEFEKKIITAFASIFGCEENDFYRSNTLVVAQEKLKNSNRVNFYQFLQKGFVLVDPNHFKKMKQIIIQNFRQRAIKESDVNSFFGDSLEILSEEVNYSYLDPAFFVPTEKKETLEIRNLTNKDLKSYQKLKNRCSIYEWEEAYIHLEQGVNFGIWQENNLLGIGGIIDWDEKFSDMSIIIHPDYRNQKYGKILLTELCKWGLEHEKILQFRHKEDDDIVRKLITSVGFKAFMTKLSYQFTFSV
jgi:GNAT superfamily N-acetyltransferase